MSRFERIRFRLALQRERFLRYWQRKRFAARNSYESCPSESWSPAESVLVLPTVEDYREDANERSVDSERVAIEQFFWRSMLYQGANVS